jgi:hypothetical protein
VTLLHPNCLAVHDSIDVNVFRKSTGWQSAFRYMSQCPFVSANLQRMPGRARPIAIAAGSADHFILDVRRQRVRLDEDLATLYGVETRVLLQAVEHNLERFPLDFMFELSKLLHQERCRHGQVRAAVVTGRTPCKLKRCGPQLAAAQ